MQASRRDMIYRLLVIVFWSLLIIVSSNLGMIRDEPTSKGVLLTGNLEEKSDFFHAIAGDNIKKVEEYLKEDPHIIHRNVQGITPLLYAVTVKTSPYNGIVNINMIMLLLHYGACSTTKNESGWTPLHSAARYGDYELVILLLSWNYQTRERDTFLREMLFAESRSGQTAKNLAKQWGHDKVVMVLESYEQELSSDTFSQTKKKEEKEFDYVIPVDTWCNHCALLGNALKVKEFLEQGADPTIQDDILGWTSLHFVAVNGNSTIVSIVLDWPYQDKTFLKRLLTTKSRKGETPKDLAQKRGCNEIVIQLHEYEKKLTIIEQNFFSYSCNLL